MATKFRTERSSTRWALAGLSLSTLLASLGTSIANVALPALAQAFGASFQEVQWIVLAYLLALTTLMVVAGRLGDLRGRRRMLLAGLVLFTTASILCGLAPTLWLLIAARAAQGAGAALMVALALALTAALFGGTAQKATVGSAMGLLGTMSAIGTALGPSVGGLLIAAFGWRAIFFASVPLGLLTFLIARRHLPLDQERPATAQAGFHRTGALIVGLLRDRALGSSLAMNALVSTVMMATLVVGPFYLSRALGLSAALVGLVLSAGPVVTALTSVPSGRLVDRVGTPRVTRLGLTAMTAGSLLLSLMPAALGLRGYLPAIIVLTVGYALFQTANNTSVMTNIDPAERGVISGLLNLSRNLGLITGASAMGAVFAWASASTDVTTASAAAVATGMRMTFAAGAGLVGAALAVSLPLQAPRYREAAAAR